MAQQTSHIPPQGPAHWFQPGDWVRLVGAEHWGDGQVQSVVGSRVTVNFEESGKQTIDTANASLIAA